MIVRVLTSAAALLVFWCAAADAAKRPNLRVTSAGAATSVVAGTPLTVTAKVRNAGPATARRSHTGFFLSRDARRSADDARLGRLRTKALRARRSGSVKGALAVPALLPGRFRLIVCADVARRIRERSERDNCRAAKRAVAVSGGGNSPVVTATAGTLGYAENDPATAIDPDLAVAEPDGQGLVGATVKLTTGYAAGEDELELAGALSPPGITAAFDAGTGELTLSGAATAAAYQQALRAVTYRNTSDAPSGVLRTVTFAASDGTAVGSATRDVAVAPVNDPPALSSSAGDATFTEGGAPVAVDSLVTVGDPDDTQLVTGSVAIASPQAGDVLVAPDAAGDDITVTGSGTPSIALAGSASPAAYRDVLRSVEYSNARNDLAGGSRAVRFVVSDGEADSAAFDRAVTVAAVNAPPVLSSSAVGDAAFSEGGAAVVVDPLITVSDELGTLTRATVTVASPQAGDTLSWTDPDGADDVVRDASSTDTVLVLSGSGSTAAYEAALRAVRYGNPRTDLTNGSRSVGFVVRDEQLDSDAHVRNVAISAVNEKPVVLTNTGSPVFTEGGAAVTVAPGVTVSDSDALPLTAGRAAVVNAVAGDRLSWSDNNGSDAITATGSGTATITFAGHGTPAEYAAALAAVQFSNPTDNPTAATRTVSFRVTDSGPLQSDDVAAARKDVTVVAVNDAPVVNLDAPGALAYPEQNGFTNLSGAAATVTDADSATLDTLRVSITSGFDAGFDALRLDPALSGFTVTPGTGAITLSRPGGTPAQFTSALRAIQFRNADDDPDDRNDGTANPPAAARRVEVVAHDGVAASTPVTRNVTITPVNDAPSAPSPLPTASGVRNTTLVSGTAVSGPSVSRAINLIANSTDPDSLESSIQVAAVSSAATANGGRITLTGSGTVHYQPPFSTTLPSDTYGYTLTDGTTASPSIALTINLTGDPVYVADQSPGPEDGTAARPFDTLADAIAVAGGHPIHIRRAPGDGVLTAGIALTAGDKLLGEGVALTSAQVGAPAGDTLFAAGTAPVLTANGIDVVTLAANAELAGVVINPDGAANGVVGNAVAGITLRSMSISDTGTAASQPGVELTGTGNALTLSGAVAVTMQSNRALNLAGAVLAGTFAGVTTTASTNGGVHLTNTTGSLTFQNLALTTTGSAPAALDLDNADNIDVDGTNFAATITAGGGPAIEATTLDSGSDLIFDSVSASGSSNNGINLSGSGTWTFVANGGSIASSTPNAIAVAGGSGAVAYAGSVANTAGSEAVNIDNRAGNTTISGNITGAGGTGITVANSDGPGTTTFSGATKTLNTGASTAVSLSSNTGHTINFTGGGLDIDTTSGNGFQATGGGTVAVTGAGNTATAAGSGAALVVQSTTISSSDLTFQSISAGTAGAGTAGNGVVLDSTGSSGGLTVTGTGTPASGGTIQRKTGADGSTTSGIGIYLNSTSDVSLSWMLLQDFDNYAVRGRQVSGFALANSTVTVSALATNGTSAALDEGSVSFGSRAPSPVTGVTGTVTITNSTIRRGYEDNLSIFNHDGTLNLTIANNSVFRDSGTSTAAAIGNDGVIVETHNARTNIDVRNSQFVGNGGDHFQATADGTAVVDVKFGTNGANVLTGGNPVALGQGLVVSSGSFAGSVTFDISNNSINGAKDTPINVNKGGGTGTFAGRIWNNTIGTTGTPNSGTSGNEDAIRAVTNGAGSFRAVISDNTIREVSGNGIFGIMRDTAAAAGGPGTLDLTIVGNDLAEPDPGTNGIRVEAGATSTDTGAVCADIGGGAAGLRNTISGDWGADIAADEIRLRHQFSGSVSFRLPNFAGASPAGVPGYLTSRNSGFPPGTASATVAGTGAYTGGAACAQP